MSKKRCKSVIVLDWKQFNCILDRKHPGPHEGPQRHRSGDRYCYMVTWWKATDPAEYVVAKEETP